MADPVPPPRIARAADAAEAGRLLHRFQVEYAAFTPGPDVLAARVRAHIASDASVFLLAGPPDAGVAQLRFREYLITGEAVATVEELYVVGERRREGHGRALLMAAFDVARARDATTIELTTGARDIAARALYDHMGFTGLEQPGDPGSEMLYYERAL